MSTSFWNSVKPEYSGEAWLAMHDHDPKKKRERAKTEREALRRGRVSNQCMDDGNLPTFSIDELMEEHGFEGFHEAIHGCGESVHIDYRRSRTGFLECDEQEGEISREELKEHLLQCCTPLLSEMLETLGNSWSTLFDHGKKINKSGCADFGYRLDRDITLARAQGKSQAEIIKLAEERLGRYFPEIVKKHSN